MGSKMGSETDLGSGAGPGSGSKMDSETDLGSDVGSETDLGSGRALGRTWAQGWALSGSF